MGDRRQTPRPAIFANEVVSAELLGLTCLSDTKLLLHSSQDLVHSSRIEVGIVHRGFHLLSEKVECEEVHYDPLFARWHQPHCSVTSRHGPCMQSSSSTLTRDRKSTRLNSSHMSISY